MDAPIKSEHDVGGTTIGFVLPLKCKNLLDSGCLLHYYQGRCTTVRIFKSKWFDRFARKEGITDGELKELAGFLENGYFDANLGGGVYKVRIARTGAGKSGGYRAIVFFNSGERVFYAYGFAKSDMANISGVQLRDFKMAAKTVFEYSEDEIDDRLEAGLYMEV